MSERELTDSTLDQESSSCCSHIDFWKTAEALERVPHSPQLVASLTQYQLDMDKYQPNSPTVVTFLLPTYVFPTRMGPI